MKKVYFTPEVEFVCFKKENLMTASPCWFDCDANCSCHYCVGVCTFDCTVDDLTCTGGDFNDW